MVGSICCREKPHVEAQVKPDGLLELKYVKTPRNEDRTIIFKLQKQKGEVHFTIFHVVNPSRSG